MIILRPIIVITRGPPHGEGSSIIFSEHIDSVHVIDLASRCIACEPTAPTRAREPLTDCTTR